MEKVLKKQGACSCEHVHVSFSKRVVNRQEIAKTVQQLVSFDKNFNKCKQDEQKVKQCTYATY